MEGLVNVHAIQVTTDYAFPALVDKLTGVTEVEVTSVDASKGSVVCTYETAAIPQISDTLTHVLLYDWLFAMTRHRLLTEYQSLTEDELEYLILVFLHEIRTDEIKVGGRRFEEWVRWTRKGIHSMFSTDRTISLEGFARFRLRSFITVLTSLAQERLQQYLLDREYEESVAMLRFMLEAQPASGDELHVFCAPDRVWITDVNGGLLRDSEVTEAALVVSNGDLNSEDLAMSILVTRSPCRIVLHDMHPQALWPSFPETIVRVFANRVHKCGHCSTCEQLEGASHHLPVEGNYNHSFRRNH